MIIIADGDVAVVHTLSEALTRLGYSVVGVGSGEEVLVLAEREHPELVLLETNLPGMSGYAVCRELKDRYGAETAVFFLSADRTESYDRVAGLLVGADDYLVKPFDPDEVVARVRRFARPVRPAAYRPQSWNLTKREQEVLDLLAEGQTEAQIAQELVIAPKTVATHIQRVLSKLRVHSRTQAVALAHKAAASSMPGRRLRPSAA